MEKSSYVLGSELWESKFDGLLALVKEYVVDVWKIQKHKLYGSDSGSGLQLHAPSSTGERNAKFSQNGKFGQNGMSGQKGEVHLGPNVSSSAPTVGAWSMAVVLWQQYEYYYYYYYYCSFCDSNNRRLCSD